MATNKKAQPIQEQAHELELTTASGQMRIIAENLRMISSNFGILEQELENMSGLEYIQLKEDIKATRKELKEFNYYLSDYEYVFSLPIED